MFPFHNLKKYNLLNQTGWRGGPNVKAKTHSGPPEHISVEWSVNTTLHNPCELLSISIFHYFHSQVFVCFFFLKLPRLLCGSFLFSRSWHVQSGWKWKHRYRCLGVTALLSVSHFPFVSLPSQLITQQCFHEQKPRVTRTEAPVTQPPSRSICFLITGARSGSGSHRANTTASSADEICRRLH